ncbi:undecaprenyl-diphosphate phosphatase [uncultured Faecalibaculum sp.]|uniref:undecaprenyl-diphosphate phosphatase n=1 Tax=uncultured Faecalibaculum sp. TaxID=1729681 RepID=UPI0026064749|nr:undecaprenyl-diphosphate phosphatase [uncultured Faecalibaculum sp.]
MTLQLAAALLLSMLTFWMPVGARIHIELIQAMIRSPWYLPLTGAAQLGMALSCLLLFRKRLMANRVRIVPAVLLILLTGLILPQGEVPPFISGLLTITIGILFLIQSLMKPDALAGHGLPSVILWLAVTCCGVIPGTGVLSMAILAGLVTGLEYEPAFGLACMTSMWTLGAGGLSHLAALPAVTWQSILLCLVTAAVAFFLGPVVIQGMKTWFSRHTLLVFGMWRICFGAVFLLVFCVM